MIHKYLVSAKVSKSTGAKTFASASSSETPDLVLGTKTGKQNEPEEHTKKLWKGPTSGCDEDCSEATIQIFIYLNKVKKLLMSDIEKIYMAKM